MIDLRALGKALCRNPRRDAFARDAGVAHNERDVIGVELVELEAGDQGRERIGHLGKLRRPAKSLAEIVRSSVSWPPAPTIRADTAMTASWSS